MVKEIKIKEDITGKKFNRLLVIERADDIITETYRLSAWKCKCECGKILVVMGQSLKKSHTKSCGCLKSEVISKIASISNIGNTYGKKNSKGITAKKIPYIRFYNDGDLTFDDFYSLSQMNCFYCTAEPNNVVKYYDGNFVYSGLDRINSYQKHNLDNVVSCCKFCNYAKMHSSVNVFINHIKKIGDTERRDMNIFKNYCFTVEMCNLNKQYFGSSVKAVFGKYNDDNLTIDQFYKLSQLNCYYCNSVPSNLCNRYLKNNKDGDFIYNGLDRVNNSLKHTFDNCITCCKVCNLFKRNFNIDYFYKWINKIINNYDNIVLVLKERGLYGNG
jgi:hypothetical protein